MSESGNGGAFLMGLLTGAAVGAALGLMYARKPGAELRDDIARNTEGLRRRAADAYSAVADTVGDLASKGGTMASDLFDKGQRLVGRAERVAEAGRDIADQTRSAVSGMRRHTDEALEQF